MERRVCVAAILVPCPSVFSGLGPGLVPAVELALFADVLINILLMIFMGRRLYPKQTALIGSVPPTGSETRSARTAPLLRQGERNKNNTHRPQRLRGDNAPPGQASWARTDKLRNIIAVFCRQRDASTASLITKSDPISTVSRNIANGKPTTKIRITRIALMAPRQFERTHAHNLDVFATAVHVMRVLQSRCSEVEGGKSEGRQRCADLRCPLTSTRFRRPMTSRQVSESAPATEYSWFSRCVPS